MARKKNNDKKTLEEACRVVREAAKKSEKKSGKWPEKGEVLGVLKLIAQILNEMNKSDMPSSDDVVSLMVNLVNSYDQRTVNVALMFLFEHLDDGLLKKVSADCFISKITEEERVGLVHRIGYISLSVNSMFLFDREERTI